MIPSVFRSLGSSGILCDRLCPLKLQPTSSAMQMSIRNIIEYHFECKRVDWKFRSSSLNSFHGLLYFKVKWNEYLCWKSYVLLYIFVISTAKCENIRCFCYLAESLNDSNWYWRLYKKIRFHFDNFHWISFQVLSFLNIIEIESSAEIYWTLSSSFRNYM